MYHVFTYNLSEDLSQAGDLFEHRDLGELDAEQLIFVLRTFSGIDPMQNNEGDPSLTISHGNQKLGIRTLQGRLYVTLMNNRGGGSFEASEEDILAMLQREAQQPEEEQTIETAATPVPKKKRNSQIIALGMLVSGLALNGYTVYSALYVKDVRREPPVTLITSGEEIRRLRDFMAGNYFTGHEQGDRCIIIYSDGTVVLQEIGRKGVVRKENIFTYVPGKRDNLSVFKLKPRGQIEILDRDTLRFFGDLYRRQN